MKDKREIGYKEIFLQKEFMKTVLAGTINRFGDSIDSIAFVWLVYQVTQSAAWSAIIFGINQVPTIFLQPFAGAYVEGKNRKLIMVVADLIRGLCVGFVATAFLMGFLNQWILLSITIIISSAEAFRKPASTAFIPQLLDKDHYEFGLSLNASASSIAELIGLGAAGIIIGLFSISVAIYIDMATFFISALIILNVRIKELKLKKEKAAAIKEKNSIKEGFLYVSKRPLIMYYAIVAVFLNGILVPFNSLQAPIINQVLHANELLLSILGVALSLGMVAGSSIYPYIANKLSDPGIIRSGCYAIGGYYFSFLIIGKWINSMILLYVFISIVSFLVGICIALLNSVANVKLIKNVEEDYLARVSAIMGAVCMGAIPIVSFMTSALVKVVTTQVILMVAGGLSIFISFFLCSKKRIPSSQENDIEEIRDGIEAAVDEGIRDEIEAAVDEGIRDEIEAAVDEGIRDEIEAIVDTGMKDMIMNTLNENKIDLETEDRLEYECENNEIRNEHMEEAIANQ